MALEGFTHLIPFAAGHEVLRQGRRELELIRMTPDVLYDQMIGMGAARRLVFSYGGNPGRRLAAPASATRSSTAGRAPLEIEEHSHAGMANRYAAGASGMPFALMRGYVGTDLEARTRVERDRRARSPASSSSRCRRSNPTSRSSMRRRPTVRATSSSGASPACRRRRCWRRSRSLVTVERIVDELEPGRAGS